LPGDPYDMRRGTDLGLLFAGRMLRLFGYGFVSIPLVLYLTALGLDEAAVGLLLSLTLLGDILLSLLLTTSADRLGRRRTLVLGAALIVLAGVALGGSEMLWLVAAAMLVGVLSPSGNEVGPFLSIEQAALSQVVGDRRRTRTFAWYNLAGSLATAVGALAVGWFLDRQRQAGVAPLIAYRATMGIYAGAGAALAAVFLRLSPAVEALAAAPPAARRMGIHRSRPIVLGLSALFALDAFAGGLILQSLVAYWFTLRFDAAPGVLGSIFFASNVLAGLSGLVAARLAARFGLVNTMVFTHLPSNVLLMTVPLMPTLETAVAALLLRFALSQMDVPTRQSYLMAVVAEDERSAAAGITTTARSLGALLSPSLSGRLLAAPALLGAPFFLSGGLKVVYDLLLFRAFRRIRPPEEMGTEAASD